MKIISLFFLIYSYFPTFGQNDDFKPRYRFTEEILSNLKRHEMIELSNWEFSFIGDYQKVLEYGDSIGTKITDTLTSDQITYFNQFKPTDAIKYISKRASKEQIIIINEAHGQPNHRVFTTKILKTLYDQGFKYFGLEAIWEKDSLNKRKYPVWKTGYYTNEPCFGNLIREAINIGFEVFNYEPNPVREDSAGINLREVEQAKNIQKVLLKDPKAKILIHCGFDHLIEDDYPSWGKAMAGRLIELTGINPFTIDQVKFTEHSSQDYEYLYYRRINQTNYSFLEDSAGNLLNGQKGFKGYDVRLYHPRTTWVYGRPNWKFEFGEKPFFLNDTTLSYPLLALAYNINENFNVQTDEEMPVPVDVIEIKTKKDIKALALKKGKYLLVLKNKNRKETKKEIEIK